MVHSLRKLLFVFPAITLLAASHLQAQPDQAFHHGPPDAEMRVAHLTRALDLSNEQSVELLEVFQAVDEERQALRRQVLLQIKPQLCELQLATEAEISRILDEDQLAELEDIKARHENTRGGRRRTHDLDCSDFE